MVKYSKERDYDIVNKIGLEKVENWKINQDRLIEMHQAAIYDNEEEQTQKLQFLIEKWVEKSQQTQKDTQQQ